MVIPPVEKVSTLMSRVIVYQCSEEEEEEESELRIYSATVDKGGEQRGGRVRAMGDKSHLLVYQRAVFLALALQTWTLAAKRASRGQGAVLAGTQMLASTQIASDMLLLTC